MSNSVNSLLSESERFAYLQAMGITLWIPREQEVSQELSPSNEVAPKLTPTQVGDSEPSLIADQANYVGTEISDKENSDSDISDIENSRTENIQSKTIDTDKLTATNNDAEKNDVEQIDIAVTPAVDISENPAQISSGADSAIAEPYQKNIAVEENVNKESAADNSLAEESRSTAQSNIAHFVKIVPWQSGAPSNDSLLIICRHQVDQPAQSFARPSSPSQFMMDYIAALQSLRDEDDPCFVRLGHLSQAGLGKDCVSFDTVLTDINPKVTLILGEETVAELFDSQTKVADVRGKKLSLPDGRPCIVSYHPYSLIKNPQLKPLALEDLKLVKMLVEQSR
ncbi:hypothetical protein FLL45_20085 [Aliikangiella marina]|uniref:Uracil-DNA glycosylase-like domain-containing protein n=1 Tax=Aliikangiella marina TaxID=1712262 RepID=A0A545T2K8_9GAMM|nr:hypothetical protein [Aliikangiella marina]TQV71457.1 hypothetical protein FLL45_20085 [Aliikangiella marina]